MRISVSLVTVLMSFIAITSIAQSNADAIVGKWEAYPKKNLIVQVFKDNNEFKARIVWFNDSDDKTKPMDMRLDEKNPDPSLRSRKILGMEVLQGMVYNANNNRWESGKIYDAKSGRVWSSSAWITKDNILHVRGFWHFEFIGQNMNFKKV